MAFNLVEFKHRGLIYGGARPSLFQLSLSPDISVPGLNFDVMALEKLPFVASATSIPESTLGTIDVPYFGRTIKEAGDRDFGDWTITVMNDEDFLVRGLFEKWSNDINRHESNIRTPGLDLENYKADFNVRQFSKTGVLIRSYKLIGAWPARVSAIDLAWEARNQIEIFQVSFAYDWWLPDEEETGSAIPYMQDAVTPSTV